MEIERGQRSSPRMRPCWRSMVYDQRGLCRLSRGSDSKIPGPRHRSTPRGGTSPVGRKGAPVARGWIAVIDELTSDYPDTLPNDQHRVAFVHDPVCLPTRASRGTIECMNAHEKFRDYLAARGRRMTRERTAILAEVLASRESFGADQLMSRIAMRKDGGSVSRATVCRALFDMVDALILRRFDANNGEERFDRTDEG